MISRELASAREYEEKEGARISGEERPVYHFTARAGWLNDPNGFSFYKGEYHLFYQYHPYNSYWGPMHWGHAVSEDMIKWEYLPCALAPDAAYDGAGCFSGSALTLPDGRQLLMYTGCSDDGLDPLGKGRWKQLQCAAVLSEESGEYVKSAGNPVIREDSLPEGCDPYEFRDPYIWQAGDGSYRAIAAAGRTGEISSEGAYIHDSGTRILMYKSDDGFSWTFDRTFFEDGRRIGVMWECPGFFSLGDRHVLIASPMDMALEEEEAAGSIRFPKGNNVCCITGSYDEDTETFTPDGVGDGFRYEPVDCGLDFYAPQVMVTPDGRRVMIGWMQDPATANYIEAGDPSRTAAMKHVNEVEADGGYAHGVPGARIFGQMTVPRELKLRDGRLFQWPVRELRSYRRDKTEYSEVHLCDEERELKGISGRSLEMDIDIKPAGGDAPEGAAYGSFTLGFAGDGTHRVTLSYRPDRSLLTIDRSRCGQNAAITSKRSIRVRDRGGELSLRVLLDKWSAEIFINGGEQVMSLTYYTPDDARGISFAAEGSVVMDVTSYTLGRAE